VTVRVINSGGPSNAETVELLPFAPRVVTTATDGAEYALLFHGDGSPVSARSPAILDEIVTLYAIGLGPVQPVLSSGVPASANSVAAPVIVFIGDRMAQVQYAGLVPGFVGLYQVNFQVPADVIPSQPNVLLQVGQNISQRGIGTWVKGTATGHHEFFVAPDGNPNGTGSRANPWDLATAFGRPAAVQPGDVIWLRGGTYGTGTTTYTSSLIGTADQPVTVRQFPGERATINGGLIINGANAAYWGFEVASLLTGRTGSTSDRDDQAPDAISVFGPGTKFINLVVHDAREGFGFWQPAENAEIYGCLIFHNGWQGPDRGHGHGIYTQNQNGIKTIADNIIFNQFGLGIQAYGTDTTKAFVQGYSVDGNVIFDNGALSRDGYTDNLLFGIASPISNLHVTNNYTYDMPSANMGGSRVGWGFGGVNRDAVVTGNYFMGGYFSVELWNWSTLQFSGNSVYSPNSADVYLQLASGQNTAAYSFDRNTYYGANQFYFLGQLRDWTSWRSSAQIDAHSSYKTGPPTGQWIFVRPNKYEAGRANIVIYNWDLQPSAAVDLSTVLKVGDTFEVRDAENYFGPPAVSGKYTGSPVKVPMSGLTVMSPNGAVPRAPQHTAPQFGAFVLLIK
jgi:hypothetical protein